MSGASRPPSALAAAAALVAALALAALASRTAMPVDETRYLAVAWEMWLRGDFLVPHLNGVPYSHKPPLLFWLVQLGWAVAGPNDLWPRLVMPLCAIATLAVTVATARTLWPDVPARAANATWILAGTALFALFGAMLMFDVLLALAVATGLAGLAEAARGRRRGFFLLAAGIGGGLLAKGPAVLLHLMPAALLAPWWIGRGPVRWRRWYAGVALALLAGAVVVLAWALPASARGGDEYRDAILWGQTAHRMVDAFAHQRPPWWYLPWLPLVLAPWLVWRPFARGAADAAVLRDRGVRLALAAMLPALAGFSLVSGKQLHYLVPQLPAFALLAARAIDADAVARRAWLATAALAALAIAVVAVPHVRLPDALADLGALSPIWAAPFAALALWVGASRRTPIAQVPRLAIASVAALAALHLAFVPALSPAWDMRPVARAIAGLQRQGRPLLHDGVYHGQYQFAGRLRAPLAHVDGVEDARRWIAAHPDGAVIVYFSDARALDTFHPIAAQRFRGRRVAIVMGDEMLPAVELSRALERGGHDDGAAGDLNPAAKGTATARGSARRTAS